MTLGLLADYASLIGLMISVIGFAATFRNVQKARKAAEEARESARKTLERVSERLAGEDLATTLQFLGEVRTASAEQSWGVAILRCGDVSNRLSHMLPHPALSEGEQDDLVLAVSKLQSLHKELERRRSSSENSVLPERHLASLNRTISTLGRIRGRLLSREFEA